MANWTNYHSKTASSPPRPTLLKALTLLPIPGHAIDLGCGSGRDTLHLLEQGWTVLAIDNQQTTINCLQYHHLWLTGVPRCVTISKTSS